MEIVYLYIGVFLRILMLVLFKSGEDECSLKVVVRLMVIVVKDI